MLYMGKFRMILGMLLSVALLFSPVVSAISNIDMLVQHDKKMEMSSQAIGGSTHDMVMDKDDCCDKNHACNMDCSTCFHAGSVMSNSAISNSNITLDSAEFVMATNLHKPFSPATEPKPPK